MGNPGAGSMDRFWAGGFLYDAVGNRVFLHQRDGNTKINPHKWAFFGGLNEGPETFVECFCRELEEEIGLQINHSDARFLRQYENVALKTHRVVFYVESDVETSDLSLGEGAGFGWIDVRSLENFDLTDMTRDDLEYFLSSR